jgi:hypothetical protein
MQATSFGMLPNVDTKVTGCDMLSILKFASLCQNLNFKITYFFSVRPFVGFACKWKQTSTNMNLLDDKECNQVPHKLNTVPTQLGVPARCPEEELASVPVDPSDQACAGADATALQSSGELRNAVLEHFASLDGGKYDMSCVDSRGVPQRLVDGSALSKQQVKKVQKIFASVYKKHTKLPAKHVVRRDKAELPPGYWDDYPQSDVAKKRKSEGLRRLGIDVGGVLSPARRHNGVKQGREDTELNAGISDECITAVRKLVEAFGADHTFIVSKAGGRMSQNTLRWLQQQEFHSRTGLHPGAVYFCKERAQKAGIAEALGLTHFIDDRWSVLEHLTMCERRYLFPNDQDNGVPKQKLFNCRGGVLKASGWDAVLKDLHL